MKLSYKQTMKKKILSLCNHNVFINVLKVMFCEAAGTTEHMDDKHANQCDKPS